MLAVPLQGSLQGGVTVYEVPLSLTGADRLPLLVGMTANVKIQVGQAMNALLVPTLAVQKVGGKYQVLVPNATAAKGEATVVPVEVGLSDGTYTQITNGLKAGGQVIVQLTATQSSSNQARSGGGGLIMNLSRMFGGR